MPRTTTNRLGTAAAVALLAILAGCTDRPATAPLPPRADIATAPLWAVQESGVTDDGARYSFYVPYDWSGDLFIFVHGYVAPWLPLALPDLGAAPDSLGRHGFAIAVSSYAENGWAVKDGAQQTHALRGMFADRFGAPRRVYLYGQSLGGLIVVKMAEQYQAQYAGAMAECGVLGGTLGRFAYMLDTRVLFDHFYPGIARGTPLAVGGDTVNLPALRSRAEAAMRANPAGAAAIAGFTQTPIPGITPDERIRAIADQIVRHAREIDEMIARGHGAPPVGNRDTRYTNAALDDAQLDAVNASVARFDAGGFAQRYAEQYYEPTGELRIPLLTMPTTRDPAFPAVLSGDVYRARVQAAGREDLLAELPLDRYGHCAGTIPEKLATFYKLVAWVESGARPQ